MNFLTEQPVLSAPYTSGGVQVHDTYCFHGLPPAVAGYLYAAAHSASHSGRDWVMRKPDGAYQLCTFGDFDGETVRQAIRDCADFGSGDDLDFADGEEFWALRSAGRCASCGFPAVRIALDADGRVLIQEARDVG